MEGVGLTSSSSKVKPFNTLKSDHKKVVGKKTIPKELFHGTFWRERQRTEEDEEDEEENEDN